MQAHAAPIDGFLDSLHDWLNSIHLNRQDAAKVDTERLKVFARLLSEDNEFKDIFASNVDSCRQKDPEEAMKCVYAFFNAVADASRPNGFPANRSYGRAEVVDGAPPDDRRPPWPAADTPSSGTGPPNYRAARPQRA